VTRFAVDLAELSATIADMAAFEDRLARMLAELDAAVTELHTTWTGAAADAHRDAHGRWRAGAQEMHQAATRMRQAAERAHGNYSAAGRANAAMWSQTR